ncbi:MAG: GtrA family protein [Gallionellaceae bacterium]|jgi:putative flippase GtrA
MLALARQFTKYAGVGVVSAIGHYGLLIGLVQGLAVDAVLASTAGAFLGAWINYSLNYRYTFRSNKRHSSTVAKFALIAVVGLVFNAALMWLGTRELQLHYLLSQIITTICVLFWNFAGNRYWTFRH